MSLTKKIQAVSLHQTSSLNVETKMNHWVLLIFLQILDILTTVIGLRLGTQEANFVIVWLIKNLGLGSIIFWKLLVAIAFIIIINIFKTRINLPRLITKTNYIL